MIYAINLKFEFHLSVYIACSYIFIGYGIGYRLTRIGVQLGWVDPDELNKSAADETEEED